MMERDSIRFGDTTIEYQVRRSDRRKKTVQVTVDGGGVQVAAPIDTPADDLQTLVRRRAPWILNHAQDGLLTVAPKRFVSGETLPYLGRNVRMVFEPAYVRTPEVVFDHWRFSIKLPRDLPDGRTVRTRPQGHCRVVSEVEQRGDCKRRHQKMVAPFRRRRCARCAHSRPTAALG